MNILVFVLATAVLFTYMHQTMVRFNNNENSISIGEFWINAVLLSILCVLSFCFLVFDLVKMLIA